MIFNISYMMCLTLFLVTMFHVYIHALGSKILDMNHTSFDSTKPSSAYNFNFKKLTSTYIRAFGVSVPVNRAKDTDIAETGDVSRILEKSTVMMKTPYSTSIKIAFTERNVPYSSTTSIQNKLVQNSVREKEDNNTRLAHVINDVPETTAMSKQTGAMTESIITVRVDRDNAVPCNNDSVCKHSTLETICRPMPNDTNSGYCLCVKSLTILSKEKECPPPAELTAPKSDVETEHDGVIYFQHVFKPDTNHTIGGPLRNDLSKSFHTTANQNVTVIPEHSSRADHTLILKIFPPIAAFLIITAIVAFILSRKLRIFNRHRKRKKGPMIKACEDLKLLDRLNVVNKNPSYFYHGFSGKPIEVRSIPIEQICIQDVVGEGAFGQVFKGLMYADENREHYTQIAVKVLKEGVSSEARDDFEREVEIMSAFEHENILKLLGIVTPATGDTPYMIFEYMVHGDLAQLLRKNDPSITINNSDFRLSKSNLIDIATQIANGMTYLNSQHFVHRDLATRNCLVGGGLAVKISDFGMARDIYTCDYYRIGGSRMLPVRWMSPESVKWGRFTSESDIWAFGVVLWEIHSYGRQPYYGHSNEEVIRFLDEGILLQRPDECPSTVYHVMLGCWKTDPKERLPFSKIYKYLKDYSTEVVRSAQLQLSGNDSETEHPA